jgi:RNA polymerase sigma-70 factor (ECF subfamily)
MSHGAQSVAFAELLRENRATLARLARHYAGIEDRQDLLQEIHLQLWRCFASYEGRATRSTWLYRVALNVALSHRRKPKANWASDVVPEIGDSGAPFDELDVLERFLGGLDPMQRAVLLLDLEGLSREQIADVLGMTANAVAIRLTRLRQTFEREFLGNP